MAKVFIHVTMSLDGFLTGPHGEMDWGFKFGSDEMVANIVKEIGAVIMGNWPGYLEEDLLPYGGKVKVPQFVVTHHPRPPETVGGLTFTFVNNLERAVNQAKAAAGEKSVALLGASIDQQCLKTGLVDEIVIHMAPVLLGGGLRLFDHLDGRSVQLKRTEIASTAQLTSLRFQVVK